MMQSVSFLLLLAPCAVAWAPAKHPAPSDLPKALEFAERAWKFPQPDQVSSEQQGDKVAIQTVQELEHEQRRYLWSKPTAATELDDQSLSCMEDSDQYYFDGHLSNSLRWPTRQAFLASLPKPHLEVTLVQEEEDIEDCEEPYFDDTGDVLCWATVGAAVAHGTTIEPEAAVSVLEEEEEECEHTYFDRIGGEELCWATLMSVTETMEATKRLTDHLTTTHSGHEKFDDDDCDEPYYDDTGDVLCWATVGAAVAHGTTIEPEAAVSVLEEEEEEECEHTYFDRIGGEELCWATLMSVTETMEATKRLTDHLTTTHYGHEKFDDDDCDEPYYDDTGDVLCWAI